MLNTLEFFVDCWWISFPIYFRKWVPGIGLDLITSHNVDFSNINVFSEFGTLSPSQTFSLFLFFRNSREYQSSSFHQQVKDFYEKDIKSTNADSGDAHDHSVSKI